MTKIRYTASEGKPEGVRETLFRDLTSELKKIVVIHPKAKNRISLFKSGKLSIFLEGKRYGVRVICKDSLHHEMQLVMRNDNVIRWKDISVKMRRGVPVVDVEKLQHVIDELLVSGVMEE